MLDKYDLIGFDPRGIGQSSPVSCDLTGAEAFNAYVPLTQNDSFSATTNFVRSVAQRCQAESGAVLPHITTANTARDMDKIRVALGEQKINYFGLSYGTALGSVYASLFPNTTDRFVLDSSVAPTFEWRGVFRAWGLADRDRFPDFAKFAAANDDIYHLGSTEAAVRQTYFELMAELDANPVAMPPEFGLPEGLVLNDELFRVISFSGLYSDFAFPFTASIWQQVKEGTISSASLSSALKAIGGPASLAVDVPEDNSTASGLSILCGDVAWSRSPAQYQTELNIDRTLAPMFGELGSNIWPCAFWTPPVEPKVRVSSTGGGKLLIVQNLRDPATPYFGAVDMRIALGNRARLVSVDQGGHGAAYVQPNTCATDKATAFLANGIFPAHDSFCAAQPPESPSLRSAGSEEHKAAVRELMRRMVL